MAPHEEQKQRRHAAAAASRTSQEAEAQHAGDETDDEDSDDQERQGLLANDNHESSSRRGFIYPLEVEQEDFEFGIPLLVRQKRYTSSSSRKEDQDNSKCQLSRHRWIQLFYLSLLAWLSDWICFSTAAHPPAIEAAYPQHPHITSANLIDWFLFTNVLSCFCVTDLVNKFGLQRCIQGASIVMMVGAWCRSGGGWVTTMLHPQQQDDVVAVVVSPTWLIVGTILVGAAQPMVQCTPPLLSALWFAESERATATAIALNFNQIGIATAFAVGGPLLKSSSNNHNHNRLPLYFGIISLVATLLCIGTLCQFQNLPPYPPSKSQARKRNNVHENHAWFGRAAWNLGTTNGFCPAWTAFVCSIAITNVVGTFLQDLLQRISVPDQQISIAQAGTLFEFAIVLGGIVLGHYVDHSKRYKYVTVVCLIISMFAVLPLGWTKDDDDDYDGYSKTFIFFLLFVLGFVVGPIQPINAELAVEVTFPEGDETAVESVQQIGGNLLSAVLVPVAKSVFGKPWFLQITGDVWLMVGVAALTLVYYQSLDAPLKRTMADRGMTTTTSSRTASTSATTLQDNEQDDSYNFDSEDE